MAKVGHLGHHHVMRDVSRDVGDPEGGEGLSEDEGTAGGGPGHPSMQTIGRRFFRPKLNTNGLSLYTFLVTLYL
jgi:hypothetical protein